MPVGEVGGNCSNNKNNIRLSFDTLKQGPLNHPAQRGRDVVAQNLGFVVLYRVATLKKAVPPPPHTHTLVLAVGIGKL